MAIRRLAWGLAVSLVLPGCAPSTADLAAALAKDPASVCLTITTIYGTVRLARTAMPGATVACTPDGLTVTPRP